MPDNPVPEWARDMPLLIQREWHPLAVWETTRTGRVLRTFPDEYLAAQFVLNNGGEIIPNHSHQQPCATTPSATTSNFRSLPPCS